MPDAEGIFDRLYRLLETDKKLALAVSGGSDSTALMLLAAQWARDNDRLDSICVLTVDHALRDGSDQEAGQVCRWAQKLGLSCHVLVWQHDGQDTKIQQKAREHRYVLMSQWCTENKFDGIITAHNCNDQAETTLMRLARGSGVDGLAAMAEQSDLFGTVIYRPLLDVSRQALQEVLLVTGHEWIDDPSNYSEKFERVRLRQSMADIHAAGISTESLNLSARRLKRASRALEVMTGQFMALYVTVFDSGHCEVDRQAFENLPDEIAIRVLSRLLDWAGGGFEPVRMAKVERLYETLADREQHTLAGAQVAMRKASFLVGREFGRISTDIASGVYRWDNRFVFDRHHDVQPYGLFIDNDDRQRPEQLPYFVACSLPAFVETGEKEEKLVVPHLDFVDKKRVSLCKIPAGVEKAVKFNG